MKQFFTSESVTEGHPDKICDQISDAILDAILRQDPYSRVAVETLASNGFVVITGEVTTNAVVDYQEVARKTIKDIGYNKPDIGFNGNSCGILVSINKQSPDIAMGVNNSLENRRDASDIKDLIGAGDQGIMFGYACTETDTYMPTAIYYSHKLAKRLADVRKNNTIEYLRPDGKTQVTVEYEDGKVVRIDTILISTSHNDNVSLEQIRNDLIEHVIKPTIPESLLDNNTKLFVNPTGKFVICGPQGDSGLTGRKIIVDTYGGAAKHGGGAYSGKDSTKVDRSASYMARYAAKNLVAAGVADKLEIQVSYAIGVAKPLSIFVDTFGTGKYSDDKIIEVINKVFDFRPAAIIETLNLRTPIYLETASYGHFGRDNFPWEKLDKVETIKSLLI